ncbi:protein cereblon isoform X2 [Leptidea sinapis]|uniref:protein cereblon isoform X2 n=1 Tax=Leptidea sinapis TaxID=189913 RepID=UPI0021C3E594|nr:protein cereblon isoform X2 [Leptidea sinapis]
MSSEDEEYSSGAGDADENVPIEQTNEESDAEEHFDITLAASHSYMGAGLEAIKGRSVLEAGWTGKVPVIAHHGAVFPGETVPMLLTNSHDAAMVHETLRSDKLFGLLCPDETGNYVSGYGVLCEVFEARVLEDNIHPNNIVFKARAINRFRFLQMPRTPQSIHIYIRMRLLDVIVPAEVEHGEPLREIRLASLDRWRRDKDRNVNSCQLRKMDALMTSWPLFVYDIFDFRRMRHTICEFFRSITKDIPDSPVALSFWVASNLALSPRERLALFIVDDALLRLHMAIRLMGRLSVMFCSACTTVVAKWEDVFSMSSEGPHSNYTNLVGYMHDILTVRTADNLETSGPPSAEFSWFPGYKWTIMVCRCCMVHIGWRFDAEKPTLRPRRFFALSRNHMQFGARSAAAPPSRDPVRSITVDLHSYTTLT